MKKISSSWLTAFGTCAVAAVLSACSGAGQPPVSTVQTPLLASGTAARATSPSGVATAQVPSNPAVSAEILTGKAKVKCKGATTFRVRGTAAGPYSGTFIATGSWASQSGVVQPCGRHENCIIIFPVQTWDFKEDFTITSGSSAITGHITGSGLGDPFSCTAVSNLVLSYSTLTASGKANVKSITQGDFRETLFGL
jgi:hypothetical protein